jgi:hypothetical protein
MGELQDLLASTDGDAGKAVRIEAERARLLGVQLN